jgi:uncharacterized protein (TIGR04222 family)
LVDATMNLNPFDLSGPEFLCFYFILLLASAVVARLVRRLNLESAAGANPADVAQQLAKDPYAVAYLRGGRDELLRVTVVSLIERGLVRAAGSKLELADADAAAKTRLPLDKTILMAIAVDGDGHALYSNDLVRREADLHALPLRKLGVLPDDACRRSSAVLSIVCVFFLWLIAFMKIVVALSRGHFNIGFLIIMAIAAVPVLIWAANVRTTTLGRQTCRNLQDYFQGLHGRRDGLRLSKTTSELTFLAAVFGIAALPHEVSTLIRPLRLQPQSSGGCGGGSSCGGGGCGGGGGGGGCGGCS